MTTGAPERHHRAGPLDVRRLFLGDWSEVVRDPIDVLRGTLFVGAVAMGLAGEYGAATRLMVTFVSALIARALDPHLCRCGSQPRILRAAVEVLGRLAAGGDGGRA